MGRIVWIASYPKSGNTWVRLFLHALDRLREGPCERLDFSDPGFRLSLQDNARALYEPCLPMGWERATKADMARARTLVHRRIAASAPGLIPVKTHNALIRVEGAATITPEVTAHAVYIVRNPLDVAVSVRDHFGAASLDLAVEQMNFDNYVQKKDARFVDAPLVSWRQNVASWTGKPDPRITVIRYEDMLEEPEAAFARVLSAFGREAEAARRGEALALTRFERLQETEREGGFPERSGHAEAFFARGGTGAGAAQLPRTLRRRILRANEALMARFGYLA